MTILTINRSVQFFEQYVKYTNVVVIYKELRTKILKAIRQIHLKSGLPGYSIWYTKEFKALRYKNNDSVIFFDTALTLPAVNYLSKTNKSLRIIYWFWNHVYNPAMLNKLPLYIEKWSYDPEDCSKYGFKFNTQFHFKEFGTYDKGLYTINQDCVFVGADKGRLSAINECATMLDQEKVSKYFKVVDYSNKLKRSTSISYHDVIELVRHSRCVVDIMPEVQKGMSLRPLEALMVGKKLITNFEAIKDMPFYDKNNVFIMGIDCQSSLREFINNPVSVDSQLASREYYDFSSWLRRFEQ